MWHGALGLCPVAERSRLCPTAAYLYYFSEAAMPPTDGFVGAKAPPESECCTGPSGKPDGTAGRQAAGGDFVVAAATLFL